MTASGALPEALQSTRDPRSTKLQTIGEDFCGLDVNTPLGGEQPVSAVPVLLFDTRLTAVVATSTGDFTVVFIGTAKGHLKKVVVESSTSALEYGDLVVEEDSPVNPDLHFDSQSMHLYVMTEKKVSKVKVQECTVYRNCLECLGVKDPYCGWCSLENKCSLRSDCQDAAKDPLYWISYKNHFTAKLSVRTTSGPDFVATNFTFFDCNTYSSCTQCVSSSFPCDWCVDGHRCTHDTAENCRNDILVTGVSRAGPSYRSGPAFCPTINATVGNSPEILVASGIKKAIKVKVHIIGQFIVQTRFVCQFNIEGRVTSVNAQLLGDTIYCDAMEFSYTSRAPNITATFAVIWGGSKPLDNPYNIHIVIYRCRDMADNCGICLALAEKYDCGWCQSSDRCEVKDQCEKGSAVWLNRSQTCPNPEVTSFSPELGPWEGGTNITIQGINLGKNFQDIYSGISIAGISPKWGPKSGGTMLQITGEYMNAGSNIQAFLDFLPCRIVSTDQNQALCITSASNSTTKKKLRMKFDKGDRYLENMMFEYVEDPVIESAESGVASQIKVPKGIPAGGIKISVTGRNLAFIQKPQMYVFYEQKMFISECSVLSNTSMTCNSPVIDAAEEVKLDADNPLKLEYGFRMDNVTGVQNLTLNKEFNPFLLYPNPLFIPFEKEVKYYKSDYLNINGQNIDRACQESDVRVLIGKSTCNVTSLSRQQLTCRPPESQPQALNDLGLPNGEALPEVVVIVGGSLRYNIGVLSYSSPQGLNGPITKPTLYGIISVGSTNGAGLKTLESYRRKSTESNRVLKNMQEQMDILELRVAAECKEAFAELQTEMTDLTGDLTSGGIPFLDYRTYAMKILFPNVDDHIVLQWERPELLCKEKGLRLFGQLIMNKTFLLLFIRTLESNRYFSMRDRVNVASLIMVTLQSKMEYCTDILKTLLAELIEKCMEGKSHPKLLLRRECAGEPLFMLFRAVKQQVDKGPVDAITSEARYSLSEEKLIRQSIDFKPMTVYVSISQQPIFGGGIDHNTDNVPVKVLDCDTISQVKEKSLDTIYRATPYSQRPRKDDLDLEWRTGTSGRLILYDEDSTTKVEGDWKRRNTLQHYRVPDGGCLNLVSKQSSIYNLSIFSEKNDKSHKYETLNLSKFSSGLKVWHLVKHHDNDNQKEGERGNKMVSEIYLTRLLATKGTLQKFVDDLFETIFSTAHRGSALPLAIKYMFDFLDDQALQHGISDPEVVHTWKSNSLPLRFWVNLIKNPNFVFDIHKSNIVDSCLSVVAQTFMDSCSTSDHRLGKDSPSSKLLYAKDIPCYKEWVERYYSDIKTMPAISDQDMNAMLAEDSRLHTTEFNTNCALHELYTYAMKYNEQLTVTLEEDEFSQKQRLAYKLEQVHNIMAEQGQP
ncbi:unnamed protein product [Phaedon cochleariae]|uniref:Sema domain-containing protein n=1 Tax=Phaedon cochleariae TaxID=80249 RepID=A0A9N9SC24_PHACE|nr:unnamed protein product [Phaedon cochleariae]